MKLALRDDRAVEKAPAAARFVSRVADAFSPDDERLGKNTYWKYKDAFYATGSSLRVGLPSGYEHRVSICPISEDFEVANRGVARGAHKRSEKLPLYHDQGYTLEMEGRSWTDDDHISLHYSQSHKPYRIIAPAPPPTIRTPEPFIAMLQASGRTKAAARIAELVSICTEDEDEHYEMVSLMAIVRFFLDVPKVKNTSNISLSPSGTFAASWFGSDGKIRIALEFLGDKVLLIRRVNGRAKASRVDQLEAQRHLP